MFLRTSAASSGVIGDFVSEAKATTRMSAPSSSRMFEGTTLAMNEVTSSGTGTALVRAPTDLAAAIEEAIEQVHASTPKLRIENRVPAGTAVEADAGELARVFANLLRNAGEAGATRAEIGAAAATREIEVTVTDDGPGLPDPVRQGLFRRFALSIRGGGSIFTAMARSRSSNG